MSWFNNLSIQLKLMAGFGLVLVLTVAVSGLGAIRLAELADRSEDAYTVDTLGLQYANQVNRNMIGSGREQQTAFLQTDPQKRAAAIDLSREQMKAAEKALLDYHVSFASAADEA